MILIAALLVCCAAPAAPARVHAAEEVASDDIVPTDPVMPFPIEEETPEEDFGATDMPEEELPGELAITPQGALPGNPAEVEKEDVPDGTAKTPEEVVTEPASPVEAEVLPEISVEIVYSPEEAAEKAPMAEGEAFFTIDATTGDVEGEAVFEDFTEDGVPFEEVVLPADSVATRQDKIVERVEESELFCAAPAGDGAVEVTAVFSNQRLILPGAYSESVQSYGANAAVYYDDRLLLTYDTPEATAEAYHHLVEDYGENAVLIDYPLAPAAEGWGYAYMNLAAPEKQAAQGAPVTVAVIDSGIMAGHRIFSGTTILQGKDFANNDNDPSATYFHGTAVAGIIAESTPANVSILPIQVTNERDVVDTTMTGPVNGVARKSGLETIMQAIDYAVLQGADLINLSIGGTVGVYYEHASLAQTVPFYTNKINACTVPIICAAGNDNADVDANYYFPACVQNTICVAGIANDGTRWSSSNYGSSVDFAAPGSSVRHAMISSVSAYGRSSGTSFAAPYVTAAAALILAQDPACSRADLYEALRNISVDLGESGKDRYFGYGCPVFSEDWQMGTTGSGNASQTGSNTSTGGANASQSGTTDPSNSTAKKNISELTIIGPKKSVRCTGKALRPSVKIKDGDRVLTRGKDYTLSYTNNVKCGTGKVTIRMKGKYTGSAKRTFRIVIKKATYTGIAKYPVNGKWYRVKKGRIDWKFTGIARCPENKKYYYVRKGRVRWNYTGMVKDAAGREYRVVRGRATRIRN